MHMHAVVHDRIDACNLGLNLSPLNIYTYTSIKLTPLHSLSFDIYTQVEHIYSVRQHIYSVPHFCPCSC